MNADYGASLAGDTKEKAKEKSIKKTRENDDGDSMKVQIEVSVIFLAILMYFSMGSMIGASAARLFIGAGNPVSCADTAWCFL